MPLDDGGAGRSYLDFSGKVVIITGAARGQGRAEVDVFVGLGASVVACDVRQDELSSVSDAHAGGVLALALDVTEESGWTAATEQVMLAFGRIDVLVNNAGIIVRTPLVGGSFDDYLRVVAVNQTGTFLGMCAVSPHMIAAGGGAIVNISSTAAFASPPQTAAYAASKGAVVAMTKVAAQELGVHGIRVNAVLPGHIETPMNRNVGGDFGAVPLGRIGRPAEMADVVVFLASDRSSYCNGATLVVDGGWTSAAPEIKQPIDTSARGGGAHATR
jgi:3alpha(or 20beta)-hydroxysteroid dehydrogenase